MVDCCVCKTLKGLKVCSNIVTENDLHSYSSLCHARGFPQHVKICNRCTTSTKGVYLAEHFSADKVFRRGNREREKIAALHVLTATDKERFAEKERERAARETENNKPLGSLELFLEPASLLHLHRS